MVVGVKLRDRKCDKILTDNDVPLSISSDIAFIHFIFNSFFPRLVMSAVDLDIKLKKASKTFCPGETVKGSLIINSKSGNCTWFPGKYSACQVLTPVFSEFSHSGIFLKLEGMVTMQLSSKSVGLFEAFYNSVKPIQLISINLEVSKSGKIQNGKCFAQIKNF